MRRRDFFYLLYLPFIVIWFNLFVERSSSEILPSIPQKKILLPEKRGWRSSVEKSRVKIGEKIENSSTRAKRDGWTRYTAIRRKIASEVACARLHKRIQWDEKKRKGGREERNKKKKKLAGSRKGGGGEVGEEKRREEKRKQRDGDHPQGRIMAGKMRWATPCQAF